MTIEKLSPESAFFTEVINLGNRNSKTLGFLPEGAYQNYCERGQILIVHDDEQVMGYLLYGVNSRSNSVYIVHLCIAESFRGQGVSHSLITELKTLTRQTYRGIRVKCRTDYGIDRVWERENFQPLEDLPGRSKSKKTELTYWWFDHGHSDLFSGIVENLPDDSILVVMDANVFYDLHDEVNLVNLPSHALKADWLNGCITLSITPELYNEIKRSTDLDKKKQARQNARKYVKLKATDEELNSNISALRDFFSESRSPSNESDLRQLAYSVANSAEVFVTRDDRLLKLGEAVHSRFGLNILHPSDLILQVDSTVRESEYYPDRYKGTSITCRKVGPADKGIEITILAPQNEKLSDLRRILNNCYADTESSEVMMYHSHDELHAVIAYRVDNNVLDIPVFRVIPNKTTGSLARQLLKQACLDALSKKCMGIRLTESHLTPMILRALKDLKFALSDCWKKLTIPFAGGVRAFHGILTEAVDDHFTGDPIFTEMVKRVESASSSEKAELYHLERYYWPSKFLELDIPIYLIPIQPRWAMNLFDTGLSNQDLFGGEPKLVFSLENAYYRSARPAYYKTPARILWYISKGKNGVFAGTQAVSACSYLDEVIIGKPKEVFKELKKLGVFQWNDVFVKADNDLNKKIMGLRFSHTELFSKRVMLEDLREIWQKTEGKPFSPPQCPRTISNRTFFEIYRLGQELEKGQNA